MKAVPVVVSVGAADFRSSATYFDRVWVLGLLLRWLFHVVAERYVVGFSAVFFLR